MCGIFGIISKKNIIKTKFNQSLRLIKHRGPDNESSIFETLNSKNIALGHTRLSIIDLSEKANQPLSIGKYTIIFNGEIYNYKTLKLKLEKEGVVFKTESDTETIIQSYIKYGIKTTVKNLNGMFAFAILDRKKGKLILARDRIGIKPLYFFINSENFVFSSELKSIREISTNKFVIDINSIANYFFHKYVSEPTTIFEEISALNPGYIAEFDIKNFSFNTIQYWKLEKSSKQKDETKVLNDIDEILNRSLSEHLISDVPISFAFSGGLDSSLLIAMAKQYKKDIVGFTIKRNENDIDWIYSLKIAKFLKIDHLITNFEDLNLTGKDVNIYKIYDQPIGCSSIYSTYLLYKTISKKFKVCISGDGGDEIFGGYSWYQYFLDMKNMPLDALMNKNRLKHFINNKFFSSFNDIKNYKDIMLNRYSKKDVIELLDDNFEVDETSMYEQYIDKINSIQDMQYVDFFTFLRFALKRTDFSSMAHSVENRVPFLDHRLVEYAFSIDPKLVYKDGELKYLLKKLAERYLPKEFIYRPKKGFSAPLGNILPISSAKESMHFIFNKWKYYHNQ